MGYVYDKSKDQSINPDQEEQPLIKQHSEYYIKRHSKKSKKSGYVYDRSKDKSINPSNKSQSTSETQKTAGLFTGNTTEYVIGYLGLSVILGLISSYFANAIGQGNAVLGILMFIFVIASIPVSILLVLARIRFLKLNILFLILIFVPIVNTIFGLVLIFLQPKSDTPTQPIKTSPPEKKSPAPSPKAADKDEEIEDLEKQIKIAELKKKLKDLENE